ncbi:PTS system mannose/fructose/sorbose family transporter subunit IID [Clostridium sp. CF012]|uniref:PTS system mannose/fructose/sorbose family transporter subunit IID n=1 Tax=Clostridium sp. CF012 TaxID=2843319 RepID=UPI001C0D7CEE|nr:PTS system mannose/fructose/sorbose family transporter subunit IID [Clostridium sp. CF012]MBU3143267.1 PTS system mannose/fructose/sorbose family transporter subunit IID [Clostridium sp. CF012]
MKQEINAENKDRLLTKKDIFRSWLVWINTVELSNSFERLQALTFAGCMSRILEKLYKNKDDLKSALKRNLIFFNTEGTWGSLIHGITIAMEEKKAMSEEEIPDEMIINVKTGFMGPLAGIGDTITWGTIRPIVLAFFLPLAASGSMVGAIGPIVVIPLITWTISYQLWSLGYRVGKASIMEILKSGKIKQVISFAGVLGLFMMGVLSSQFVKFEPIVKYKVSGKETTLLSQFDKILPGILALSLVFFIDYLITKKKIKYTTILLGVLTFSLIASFLKIF